MYANIINKIVHKKNYVAKEFFMLKFVVLALYGGNKKYIYTNVYVHSCTHINAILYKFECQKLPGGV